MFNQPKTQEMTVQNVWDMFFTPVSQNPTPDPTQGILAEGKNFHIPFGTIDLALTTWGTGPIVYLLHGWGSDRTRLGAFVNPLVEAGYRPVAIDFPAHGNTPGEQTNLFEERDALLAVVKHLGQPHAIIAHSLGTLASMMSLDKGLDPKRVVHIGSLRSVYDGVERFYQMASIPDHLWQAFRDKAVEVLGDNLWELTSAVEVAPRVFLPALLIHDDRDRLTPVSDTHDIAAAWPGAERYITSGLGHRRILKDPAVIEKVVDFIKD